VISEIVFFPVSRKYGHLLSLYLSESKQQKFSNTYQKPDLV